MNIDDYIMEKIKKNELIVCNKQEKCAPALTFNNGSCARLFIIIELAKAFNEDVKEEDKIKLSNSIEILYPDKYKLYLVKELKEKLKHTCNTQRCWTEQGFIKKMNSNAYKEFKKYTFKPSSPCGRFDWLETFDINEVLKQYEDKFLNFKFFGTVPIDFKILFNYELCLINFRHYYDIKKTQFGFVFNLDEHYKSGSHWVSLYANFLTGKIFFYDSTGMKPEKRIVDLMIECKDFMEELELKNIILDYNNIKHQYKGTECGVYSINFIINMIKGMDFYKYCNLKYDDNRINKCRNTYFNK